jgi:hypothetical protein
MTATRDTDATEPAGTDAERRRFRVTLARVIAMQIVALAVLWFLQQRYGV